MNISQAIKTLRFPLAVLVVYIHHAPAEQISLLTLTAADRPITTTLYTLLSFLVGEVAVPLFTAMSGYLYFIKIGQQFTPKQYIEQSRKRVYTLAIPYIGWIVISWLATLCYNLLRLKMPLTEYLSYTWDNLYYMLWGGPLYFPFYYIRDLMVLSLLTPMWHWLIKHISWGWIVVTLALYFALPIFFTGLSTRLLFFFSLGAYFGIKGYKEVSISRLIGYISMVITVIAVGMYLTKPIESDWYSWHNISLKLFILSFTVVVLYAMQKLDFAHSSVIWCQRMGVYSFFIYATHQIYLSGFAKGLEQRILAQFSAPLNDIIGVVTYITFPIAIVAVLIMVYRLWAKLSPRTLAPLLGGRL